jgi:hypothetical protein
MERGGGEAAWAYFTVNTLRRKGRKKTLSLVNIDSKHSDRQTLISSRTAFFLLKERNF